MAASCLTISLSPSFKTTHLAISPNRLITIANSAIQRRQTQAQFFHRSIKQTPFRLLPSTSINAHGFLDPPSENDEQQLSNLLPSSESPTKFIIWVALWASLSLVWFASSPNAAKAAGSAVLDSSIKASSFGLKIANALRGIGLPDEAVVFSLATLPVIELRGAIPVGYWLQLKPVTLTVLSVLGNMVPVPFIILYTKRLASLVAGTNQAASEFVDVMFKKGKEKAAPVEEFQWIGLMLFVAVPFPGTGAWTGAFIASILDMPFWSAVSANFFGVVIAGLLVNLLVNLGLKYAVVTGVGLFFVSSFMWSVLRSVRKSFGSTE
ncbi:hypothetical protein LINPERPRIM_LOCUS31966 [Linum perenne]